MRALLWAAVLAAIPSIASAQAAYVEGSVGFVLFPDVETDAYSTMLPDGNLFAGNAEVEYDAEWGFGLEAGVRQAHGDLEPPGTTSRLRLIRLAWRARSMAHLSAKRPLMRPWKISASTRTTT